MASEQGPQLPEGAAYARHRPEHTLLYQIVEENYPTFRDLLERQGRPLPSYVAREFDDFLRCGRLEHGFLRVRCDCCHHEKLVAFSCKRRGFCPSCGARRMAESAALLVDDVFPKRPVRQWVLSVPFPLRFLFANHPTIMGQVLRIVYRAIATYLCHKAGFKRAAAQTGAVTLIQRFGSALNLNIHFHMLFLDGVYIQPTEGTLRFRQIAPPTAEELQTLLHRITHRVACYLERQGLLERDVENSYLALEQCDEDVDAMPDLYGHSITYHIALGSQRGRKVFTLQTLPPHATGNSRTRLATEAGFSLHAGVAARADQRDKLERLCRYISRPAVSERRLSLTANGQVRYQLKTPYRERLAALVPRPRVNLTRFHGVFAPNSAWRTVVTPAGRGRRLGMGQPEEASSTPAERRAAMTWAQRLKRVFSIDVTVCEQCGGAVRVIACIEEPTVITRILSHLAQSGSPDQRPSGHDPPQLDFFARVI